MILTFRLDHKMAVTSKRKLPVIPVIIAICVVIYLFLIFFEQHVGFRWDLALLSGCSRMNGAASIRCLNGALFYDLGTPLPSGSDVINGGTIGPDHEYWFEVSLPKAGGKRFKELLLANAQARADWKADDSDSGFISGCGSNLLPLWWKTQDLKDRDFFMINYRGSGHPHGAWNYYFTLSDNENRIFIWMQCSG
jgi:hypothetical protein